jgi:hypothetical protein
MGRLVTLVAVRSPSGFQHMAKLIEFDRLEKVVIRTGLKTFR